MAWREGRKKSGGFSLDLRLTPQDRTGGPPNERAGGRAEPARRRRESSPPRQPKKRKSGKRRSGFTRIVYWGFVLALWGVIAGIGALGLDRRASAADPVAGNSQAPAVGPDPRRERRDARDARRHGRRRGAAAGIAGLRAEGVRRHRGPPLLFALRRRSARHHARAWSPTCCVAAPRKAARPSRSSSPRICS